MRRSMERVQQAAPGRAASSQAKSAVGWPLSAGSRAGKVSGLLASAGRRGGFFSQSRDAPDRHPSLAAGSTGPVAFLQLYLENLSDADGGLRLLYAYACRGREGGRETAHPLLPAVN